VDCVWECGVSDKLKKGVLCMMKWKWILRGEGEKRKTAGQRGWKELEEMIMRRGYEWMRVYFFDCDAVQGTWIQRSMVAGSDEINWNRISFDRLYMYGMGEVGHWNLPKREKERNEWKRDYMMSKIPRAKPKNSLWYTTVIMWAWVTIAMWTVGKKYQY